MHAEIRFDLQLKETGLNLAGMCNRFLGLSDRNRLGCAFDIRTYQLSDIDIIMYINEG